MGVIFYETIRLGCGTDFFINAIHWLLKASISISEFVIINMSEFVFGKDKC